MFFSLLTKNLNLEILTNKLVTFKNRIGLRMKALILRRFTEKCDF